MITVAVFALIFFHPGFGFRNKFNNLEYEAVLVSQSEPSKEGIQLIAVRQEYRSSA